MKWKNEIKICWLVVVATSGFEIILCYSAFQLVGFVISVPATVANSFIFKKFYAMYKPQLVSVKQTNVNEEFKR